MTSRDIDRKVAEMFTIRVADWMPKNSLMIIGETNSVAVIDGKLYEANTAAICAAIMQAEEGEG